MRRRLILALSCALASIASVAAAQETNFSRDVATSIDRGLAWFDARGAFGPGAGEPAGLVALALLEKRQSADLRADPVGYANATPQDQARLDALMDFIIARAANAGFGAYRDGADLMALSVYVRTGGPRRDEALAAIRNTFDRTANNQGGHGYWCYGDGSCQDSSTTQLAMAGLAAARGVFTDPVLGDPGRLATLNAAAARCGAGYAANAAGGDLDGNERGHGYRVGYAPSYQQTASGLWGQIIGGSDLNTPMVQQYFLWLRNHYSYTTISAHNNGWPNSYFYYLWSSAKAYTFIEDSAIVAAPGNLTTSDLGVLDPGAAPGFGGRQRHRDPNTDPRVPQMGGEGAGWYQSIHEPARWYYDYAYQLMTLQDGAGQYQPPPQDSRWNEFSAQSYALLVLERSVGGGCADTDRDGICDVDDNCPAIANPDQADREGDGVGDVCDNCIDIANPDQDDDDGRDDGDGRGDACECVPRAEECNGADDDCDGQNDEGDPGGGRQCEADGVGLCAMGRTVCRDDGLRCDPLQEAGAEACDGIDNDCNGVVDDVPGEGVECDTHEPGVCAEGLFACAEGNLECLPVVDQSLEICDGLDNDCDGEIDDGIDGVGDECASGDPGACRVGRFRCLGGVVACQPEADPGVERCNREDDDCDGTIDEGVRNACGRCGEPPAEACDGVDEDCDGTIDEAAPCPPDEYCHWGTCVERCAANECSGERRCAEGFCHEPCDIVQCPEGHVCERGMCHDPCNAVQCGAGQLCRDGDCVRDDCYEVGCADGQRCVDSVCEADPCGEIFCNEGEFCRDGVCVESCADVSCAHGEACRDGECVADGCVDLSCPEGEVCGDGLCGPDGCADIDCAPGRACQNGVCGHDACHGVVCPQAERCHVRDGLAQCEADWVDPEQPDGGVEPTDAGPTGGADGNFATLDATPGFDAIAPPQPDAAVTNADPVTEGCACDAAGGASGLVPLLLVAPAFALRRRRR